MASRMEFHNALKEIVPNVYYQPPENIKLKYPCIIYTQTTPKVYKADNKNYVVNNCYDLTYVGSNPDTKDLDKLYLKFTKILARRYFITNGMYHYNYTIYY